MLIIKRNITILVVIIVLIATFVFINNYTKKGTFEELVLNTYLDKAQAKELDILKIVDISDRNFTYKVSNNANIINEFLSKFNELELVKYRRGMPKSNNDSKTSERTYVIYLKNQETDEKIKIHIDSDKSIFVRVSTLVITENKKDKITEIKHVDKTYRYNIINGSIDFNYLDGLYNSLEEL